MPQYADEGKSRQAEADALQQGMAILPWQPNPRHAAKAPSLFVAIGAGERFSLGATMCVIGHSISVRTNPKEPL